SGLEKSLPGLSRCRSETELFQHGHHIVVGVVTDDLPIPDLEDMTYPQFYRVPRCWNSSCGQIRWIRVGPPTNSLKDYLILCGKRIGQLFPAIRESLFEKQ